MGDAMKRRVARSDYLPLMGRMVDGDRSAVFEFADVCRSPIAYIATKELRHRGITEIPPGLVDALVLDFSMDLFGIASGWRQDGGAAPWVWAQSRMIGIVTRALGDFADALHDGWTDVPDEPHSPSSEPESWQLLQRMAQSDDRCAEFLDQLATIRTERDRRLYVEVLIQRAMGDPSALRTVADMFGMSHAAARQQFCRARRLMERAA